MPDDNNKADSLKFKIELNVLNHLGMGLYSSTPAVMTEIIANAWDADAKTVAITLSPEDDLIRIEDTGHGMVRKDVEEKFLTVGYSRRKAQKGKGALSDSGKRCVMGRKEIGKLAMFSLADDIEIVTRAKGEEAVAFRIDVKALRERLEQNSPDESVDYPVDPIVIPNDFDLKQGTRITLSKLNSRINRTVAFLRPRLARRFSIFSKDFKIKLNGALVTRADAGFYGAIQFMWNFDDQVVKDLIGLIKNIAVVPDDKFSKSEKKPCTIKLSADVPDCGPLTGFIATVDTPKKLGKGEDSLNKISIFANGRVFQEDILPELGDTRYFNSYIVGEVHADFLDADEIDRSTANREAIRHHDPKFQALRNHLKLRMNEIRDQWDKLRRELGYNKTLDKNPAIEKWLESIEEPLDRRLADRLMTSIANHAFSNNALSDRETKKHLYRSAIVAFEKLKVRKRLLELEKITDVLSPEFQSIFTTIDDVEESYYFDITTGRLEIIEKLEENV